MTEDEAKTKICCGPPYVGTAFLLAADGEVVSAVEGVKLGNCIASACMAWRDLTGAADESLIEAIKRRREETRDGLREAKEFVEANPSYRRLAPAPRSGFCGLAGQPS